MKTSGEIVAGIKKGLTNMNYLDTAGMAFEWVVTDTIGVLLSIVSSFADYIKSTI